MEDLKKKKKWVYLWSLTYREGNETYRLSYCRKARTSLDSDRSSSRSNEENVLVKTV